MGKMLNALLLILAVNFTMILFHNPTVMSEQYYGQGLNLSTNPYNYDNGTALENFVMNPTQWQNSSIWLIFFGSLATIGGLIIGTFWIKNDFVVFAVVVGSLFSFGTPLIQLWSTIADNTAIFCVPAATNYLTDPANCGSVEARFIASLIFFALLIWYAWTIMDWWRGKD